MVWRKRKQKRMKERKGKYEMGDCQGWGEGKKEKAKEEKRDGGRMKGREEKKLYHSLFMLTFELEWNDFVHSPLFSTAICSIYTPPSPSPSFCRREHCSLKTCQ